MADFLLETSLLQGPCTKGFVTEACDCLRTSLYRMKNL